MLLCWSASVANGKATRAHAMTEVRRRRESMALLAIVVGEDAREDSDRRRKEKNVGRVAIQKLSLAPAPAAMAGR